MAISFDAIYEEVKRVFACDHQTTEARYKVTTNEKKVYFRQCMKCGLNGSQVKASSISLAEMKSLRPCDDEIHNQWVKAQMKYRQGLIESAKETESNHWWTQYNAYLQTPQWQRRRELVLQRANGICEGCQSAPATIAHHLTYERVGNELLFDLVAVCGSCHQKAHPDKEIMDSYYDPTELIAPRERETA